MTGTNRNLLERMLDWLRAGYPQGIPENDYIALFGVLHRELTAEEVELVALQLHEGRAGLDSNIPEERIRDLIAETLLEEPSEEDIRRVAGRLAQGGWPLASPPKTEGS